MQEMTTDQSLDAAREFAQFSRPNRTQSACITLAAELIMLRGQQKVLVDLLGLSLDTLNAVGSGASGEHQRLEGLTGQIEAALKGVV